MRSSSPQIRTSLVTLLCCLLLVGSAVGSFGPVAARAAPDTVEAAVEAAITEATGTAPPDGVHVVPAETRQGWMFGTALIIDRNNRETAPDVLFFLAREQGDGWQARIQSFDGFEQWLVQAPAGLLLPEVRDSLGAASQIGATKKIKRIGSTRPKLSLPWVPGDTWFLTGGPHGDDRPPSERPWSALDFSFDAAGELSGGILAAAPGVAFLPCATDDGPGPLVHLLHPKNWQTVYFHVANTAVSNGQPVQRGDIIGSTSEISNFGICAGTADGLHVHFGIKQGSVYREADGTFIGGWKISQGDDAYDGCLTKDGVRRCRGEAIFNNGELGSGASISVGPSRVESGKHVGIALSQFPPNRAVSLEFSYRPDRGQRYKTKSIRRVTTDRNGAKSKFLARAPGTKRTSTAYVCAFSKSGIGIDAVGAAAQNRESYGCERFVLEPASDRIDLKKGKPKGKFGAKASKQKTGPQRLR